MPSSLSTIRLIKDASGLGFSLDGGKDSLEGDKPLTVKKIFIGELIITMSVKNF